MPVVLHPNPIDRDISDNINIINYARICETMGETRKKRTKINFLNGVRLRGRWYKSKLKNKNGSLKTNATSILIQSNCCIGFVFKLGIH